MSLEQALEKNTAALIANTAALLAKPAPAASTPHKAQTEAKAAQGPVAPPPNPATTPPAGAAPELTYAVVAKVVSDFVKANGRRPAEILLEPFSVKTLVPLQNKPVELAGAYAAFTNKVKTDAALALAASEAAAAAPKA